MGLGFESQRDHVKVKKRCKSSIYNAFFFLWQFIKNQAAANLYRVVALATAEPIVLLKYANTERPDCI